MKLGMIAGGLILFILALVNLLEYLGKSIDASYLTADIGLICAAILSMVLASIEVDRG